MLFKTPAQILNHIFHWLVSEIKGKNVISCIFSAVFPLWSAGCLTFGLLPPMAPGLMEPVSWYRQRILDTQPWDTRSWREMTQGRIPWWAISTILWRIWLGRGLPFMKTPPSWLTRPCPNGVETGQQCAGLSELSTQNFYLEAFCLCLNIYKETQVTF